MTESNILGMLRMMGVTNPKTNSRKTHVMSSCPLARTAHAKGFDKNPSFSVKIEMSEKSVCHCFACGFGGTMMQLAKEAGNDVIEYVKKNENYKDDYFETKTFGSRLDWNRAKWLFGDTDKSRSEVLEPIVQDPFDEDNVQVLPWDSVEKYLKSIPQYVLNRGITRDTAKVWRLGYNKYFMRVMMPVIDRRNRLVGYAQRSIGEPKDGYPKYLFNVGFLKMNFLYGENLVDKSRGDIVLVEGQFDALRVYQAGYNGLAVLGSELSDVQAMKIVDLLPEGAKVVIMMDGDLAGTKASEKAFEKLKDSVYCVKRILKDGDDPGCLTEKQINDLVRTNEYK